MPNAIAADPTHPVAGQIMPNCLDLQPIQISYVKRKRLLDIFGSLTLLILLSVPMLIIAILVKATSPGPVLYRSLRVGRGGKLFLFLKFRSMRSDADVHKAELASMNEKDGPIFKMRNDPRITPIGRFLRRYSLDELPQLFNVLKGEMSLVGPRPPIPSEVLQYDDYARERLRVKPGITCYWQIMGRSNLSFQEWMELDHRYIRDMSLWTDIKIVLQTPKAVLRGEGAF